MLKPRRGRPPKNPRVHDDTKALLIRAGLEQLTETGFAGTGIDSILKKVGVPKGSFYYYFPSKEVFGRDVISAYDEYFCQKLDAHLLSDANLPLERLERFVDDAKAGIIRHHFLRGCLVGNLEQEVDLLPTSFREQLNQIYLGWQRRIEACLTLAQQRGDIPHGHDCAELAEFFWIGWEGAVSRVRLRQSVEPLDRFFSLFCNQFYAK